jgi:hypothetical protein
VAQCNDKFIIPLIALQLVDYPYGSYSEFSLNKRGVSNMETYGNNQLVYQYNIFNNNSIIADSVRVSISEIYMKYSEAGINKYVALHEIMDISNLVDNGLQLRILDVFNESIVNNYSSFLPFVNKSATVDISSIKASAINYIRVRIDKIVPNLLSFLTDPIFANLADEYAYSYYSTLYIVPKVEIASLNLVANDTTGTVNGKLKKSVIDIINTGIFTDSTISTPISYSNIKSNLIPIDSTGHTTGNILSIKSILGALSNVDEFSQEYYSGFTVNVNNITNTYGFNSFDYAMDNISLTFSDYYNDAYFLKLNVDSVTR